MTITPEVLSELVNDATAARVQAEDQLANAEDAVQQWKQRVADLVDEEESLRKVLARRFPERVSQFGPAKETPARSDTAAPSGGVEVTLTIGGNWQVLPRTVAVERAIKEMVTGAQLAAVITAVDRPTPTCIQRSADDLRRPPHSARG